MHIAVRPSVAAGVALVGAGAIALSPVQPVTSPLGNLSVSAAGVQLAASFDPVTPWVDVFTAAVSNVSAISQDWLADPAPALRQLATNWAGYADTTATALGGLAQGAYSYLTTTAPQALTTAFQQVAAGQLSDAAATINNALGSAVLSLGFPLFPLIALPGQMADNFTAVVKAVTDLSNVLPVVVGVLSPVEGGIQAFGDSAQAVLTAINAGDTVAAVNATLNIMPTVLGAIINEYTDTQGNQYQGLLSPEAGGLVYSLVVGLPQAIATALGATAPVSASRTAAVSAATVAADKPSASSARSARPIVKDGNKVEPLPAGGSASTATANAGAAKHASSNSVGAKGKSAGANKGHSARQGAGAAK